MKKLLLFLLFLSFLFSSCNEAKEEPKKRPNILFAIADDQSFGHAGAYGCSWIKTPAFDRVAKEGLLFNKAYTPNAKCAPSRSCILTGRNSWQLEEAMNHWPLFPEKFKTVAEALADHGYWVGKTGKGYAPGIALKNGEKRELLVNDYSQEKLTPPAKFISTNDYAANFEAFLNDKKEDMPFFFWYGSTEPHRSYEYGAGLEKGNKDLKEVTDIPEFWPDSDTVRTDMLDYAYEIEYFDSHLAKMLYILEERGELENTLIVVTSDNGMPFPRIKGQIYEYDNHLPLAIMWAKGMKDAGRKIEDYVNFIDFAPTFLELAGIKHEDSGMEEIRGKSLLPFLNGVNSDPQRADFVILGKERHDVGRPDDQGYPVRTIVKDGYALSVNFNPKRWPAGDPITGYLNCDGSPTKTQILNERRREGSSEFWELNFGKRPEIEFYDIKNDPWCIQNLAKEVSLKERLESMRELLFAELKKDGDPRVLGKADLIDAYKYMDKNTTDFYNRFMAGEEMSAGWVNPKDFESSNLEEND
ncbi:MAG: sulfatase [Bacteroidota bacterium]